MLGKLMKYELRATARTMLPGFGVVLILAGLCRLSTDSLLKQEGFLQTLGVILTLLFVLACMALGVLALIIMVQRFRDNLLGSEGYLMHTLPVTTAQNLLAKLLTSVIWYFGTAAAGLLAIVILAADQRFFQGFYDLFRDLMTHFSPDYAAHGLLWVLEGLLLAAVSLGAFSLVIYAAMSLGYRSTRHKGALSVLIVLAFNVVSQVILGVMTNLLLKAEPRLPELGPEASVHAALLLPMLGFLLYGALFWAISHWNLKRHLNLE